MKKLYLTVLFILAAFAVFFYGLADSRKNEIRLLTAQNSEISNKFKECKDEKETYIQAKQRAENTIGEIKTIVRTVKSPCHCYDALVDASIVDRVRGNR